MTDDVKLPEPDFHAFHGPRYYKEATVRRLIAEAVEREREACAVLCEVLPTPADYMTANRSHWECGTIDCADAIRNRSKA